MRGSVGGLEVLKRSSGGVNKTGRIREERGEGSR